MNDGTWIRSALPAAVDAAPPPADLADRAEHAARRIRRRRVGVAAAAAAVLVAVPVAAAGQWTGRAAPPVDTGDSPAGCPGSEPPPSARNLAEGDPLWPYRGDPALEAAADRSAAAIGEQYPDVGLTLPLYAARTNGTVLYVLALLRGAHWQLTVGFGDDEGRPTDLATSEDPYGTQEALLPVLDRDTHLSLLLPGDGTNLLLVLAPPGTDRIEFTGCRLGEPVSYAGDGDTLLRDVGPLDTPGRLRLLDGDRTVYAGPAGLTDAVTPPTVSRVPVPAGQLELIRAEQAGNRRSVAVSAAEYAPAALRRARLLARCSGGPARVTVSGLPATTVPCDGTVHALPAGAIPRWGPEGPADFALDQVEPVSRRPLSFDLVLVVPG